MSRACGVAFQSASSMVQSGPGTSRHHRDMTSLLKLMLNPNKQCLAASGLVVAFGLPHTSPDLENKLMYIVAFSFGSFTFRSLAFSTAEVM